MISHVGFGNGLYLRDLFPDALRIALFEWYYNADGSDLAFLRPEGVPDDERLRLRGWNAQILLELAEVDLAVTPTRWQLQQFPAWMHSRFRVIHEGVDTDLMKPLRRLRQEIRPFGLPQGKDVEVVTYLSRCFGVPQFPQAMRALAALQKATQRPCRAGRFDEIAYGQPRADGEVGASGQYKSLTWILGLGWACAERALQCWLAAMFLLSPVPFGSVGACSRRCLRVAPSWQAGLSPCWK